MTPTLMFSTRPNLYTFLVASLAVPIGLFSLCTFVAYNFRSDGFGSLATMSGVLLILTSAIALGLFLILLARRHRRRQAELEFGVEPPTCPACGYDLRSSPDHCPECGHPVAPLDRTIIQYLIRLRRKG